MERFWDAVESIWNDSRVLAWILALSAFTAVLWTSFRPQSPGVSIGLLALAAGIMSVRPKMHPAEKFAWVVVLIAFAVLEVLAIGRGDRASEEARKHENEKFEAIVSGLESSINTSKDQYVSTINHVDGVLKATQQIDDLANKNLGYLTGGKSFAVLIPGVDLEPQPPSGGLVYNRDTQFSVFVYNTGKEPLTGVSVAISRVAFVYPDGNATTDTGSMHPFDLGVIAGQQTRILPNYFMHPQADRINDEAYYVDRPRYF